jgi:hypothetical protein
MKFRRSQGIIWININSEHLISLGNEAIAKNRKTINKIVKDKGKGLKVQNRKLKCLICQCEMTAIELMVFLHFLLLKKHTSLCSKKHENQSEIDNLDLQLIELKSSIALTISEDMKIPMYIILSK